MYMKKTILILLLLVGANCFAQQKLLTKKIVYTVNMTENKINSSQEKDSVSYHYIVNKRFFWEAMDDVLASIKNKKLYLSTFSGDTIVWDTMISNLTKALNNLDMRKYSKKDIEKVLENEIRAVKFMEEWTYNPQTMLIDKKIVAYCPMIQRDSVTLGEEDLQTKNFFSFDLGWIRQTNSKPSDDVLQISRNIQYTMPIYNQKPYHWWDNNLEAEYSIPFFENLFAKTDSRAVLSYETPDAVEPFSLSDLEKRKKHSTTTSVFYVDKDGIETEKDTVITLTYNSDEVELLRFGEEVLYDKKSHAFIKNVNYYAPVIRIFSSDGQFIGFYPLYYIRKQ